MTDKELNKRIYELMGLCQHEWQNKAMYNHIWQCSICLLITESISAPLNLDFTQDWEGFGIAWGWLDVNEFRAEFITRHNQHPINSSFSCVDVRFISPRALAEAIAEFFKEDKP